MTHEGLRDPLPAGDDAARARAELEGLFTQPQSAVTVHIKKRRLPAALEPGRGSEAGMGDTENAVVSDDALERGPRVHRLTPCAAELAVAAAAAQVRHGGDATPAAAATRPSHAPRVRARRDPARRPSPVHMVLRAPPRPASPPYEPAWRRILCVAPEELSYGQVLQALHEVQALLEQAQHARRLRLQPQAD